MRAHPANATRLPGLLLWLLAAVFALTGLVMTARAWGERGRVAARLSRRLQEWRQLQALETAHLNHQAAVAAFEQLGAPYPVPLAGLVKTILPAETVELHPSETRLVLPGWTVHRTEVLLPAVRADRLMELMAKAESQRPPWRVAECTLRPLAQPAGALQARLVFESLEKNR